MANQDFIAFIHQKLKPGGYFHFATDGEDYALWVLRLMANDLRFRRIDAFNIDRAPTKFAQTGIKAGRKIWDLVL